jgi:hypothetical protein
VGIILKSAPAFAYNAHGVAPTVALNDYNLPFGKVYHRPYVTSPSKNRGSESVYADPSNPDTAKVRLGNRTSLVFNPNLSIDSGYSFTLYLSTTTTTLYYDIVGQHDPFPCCEVFIGTKLVYSYDSQQHTIEDLIGRPQVVDVDDDGQMQLVDAYSLVKRPVGM